MRLRWICAVMVSLLASGSSQGQVVIWVVTHPVTAPTSVVDGLAPSGSFGYSLDQIQRANDAAIVRQNQPQRAVAARYADVDGKVARLRNTFPGLMISSVEVPVEELQGRMEKALATPDMPDLLLGDPLPAEWISADSDVMRRYGVTLLAQAEYVSQFEGDRDARARMPQVALMAGAKHPVEARQIVVSLWDPTTCFSRCSPLPRSVDQPVAVATAVMGRLLQGDGPGGDGDVETAEFDARAAGVKAMGALQGRRLKIKVDAIRAVANERFAVVDLRATLEGPGSFGVVFGVAVLRVDEGGRWRVLQMTPSLLSAKAHVAYTTLAGYATRGKDEVVPKGAGVSLASPRDGEMRQAQPELWWDNLGGSTMQVVEWQTRAGAEWDASELFFVPDANFKLKTRVMADFAVDGLYRWRVWSVSGGGVVRIGLWRSMTIQ